MNFIIKKLSTNNIQLAKQFFIWNQKDEKVANPLIPGDDYLNSLLSRNSFHAFVALHNNIVIGGIIAYEIPMYNEEVSEMFLYDIGVEEAYRKQGIATLLINRIKEVCQMKSIKTMFVGSAMDNEAAKQLYTSTDGELETILWFTYNLENIKLL